MRYLHAKRTAILVIVFSLSVLIVILFFSKHLKDRSLPASHAVTSTTHLAIKLVSFSHSYRYGKYTFIGALTVPTVCYVASAKSSIVSSTTPKVIRIDVTVPVDTGRCLQLPATTTFSITQRASKNAITRVYLNGTLATSTTL